MWGVLVDYSWFEEQMWEQRHIFTSLKHSASPRSIVTQDLWSAFIRITSDKIPSTKCFVFGLYFSGGASISPKTFLVRINHNKLFLLSVFSVQMILQTQTDSSEANKMIPNIFYTHLLLLSSWLNKEDSPTHISDFKDCLSFIATYFCFYYFSNNCTVA